MTKIESNMNGQSLLVQKLDTRWGVFKFKHAAMGFLLGVFVFPSYFGIPVGFDLTVLRIFEIVLLVMIYQNKIRLHQFINLVKGCKQNIFIAAYFVIVCYTNVLRGFAINGILYTFFNWILVFYLMYYLIRYEWGVTRFVKYIRVMIVFVCAVSLMELVIKRPPFAFLDTLGKSSTNSRFGSARIMGNYTTTNGFGMYLMLLMPLVAYDISLRRIDILKNIYSIILIILTVFMTGNRLSVGAAILELILLLIFLPSSLRTRTIVYGMAIVVVFACITLVLQNIPIFRSILLTFFSAWDEVFGTMISVEYGANPQTLYNSSVYRDLLWYAVFVDSWLNPWIGHGAKYEFSYWYQGYALHSVDNFYVGQYITYAIPGLVAWLLMSLSFVPRMIKQIRRRTSPVCIVILISFIGYFTSLWYLDQLQTFPIMMSLFALCLVPETETAQH